MTTPRQNLLKVLGHEEPDWVPIVVVSDGYNRPIHMPPSFYEAKGLDRTLALSRFLDVDVLDRM